MPSKRTSRRTFLSGALTVGALSGCLSEGASETPVPETATPTESESSGETTAGNTERISSLETLVERAGESDQRIRMEPGIYSFDDVISADDIEAMRNVRTFSLLQITGDNNVVDLTGVTIEIPTSLREEVNPDTHKTSEIEVSGEDNTIVGGQIKDVGDGISPGGQTVHIAGDRTTVDGLTVVVRGSTPWGYGGLLGGAGGPQVTASYKQSGLRVNAEDVRVLDCRLYMHAYGHGYFIQKNARNAYFENCYVEGRMRPTDEMLAETEGPAYENDFQSAYQNQEGELKIPPGYMKSLSEDGFRTYGTSGHTFVDCTAKNMRAAFELRGSGPQRLLNCRSIGNNRGIWAGADSEVRGARADFTYGPALMVEGSNTSVDISIDPIQSEYTVHAAAILGGRNNDVTIQASDGRQNAFEDIELPIKLGFDPPLHGAVTAPITVSGTIDDWPVREPPVKGYSLENDTTLPIEVSEVVEGAAIDTHGPVDAHEDATVDVTTR